MIIIITIRLTSGACLRSSSSAALSLTCLLKPAWQHVWHPLHQRHIWTLLSWKKSRHVPFYHFSSINTCHSKRTKTRQRWTVEWHQQLFTRQLFSFLGWNFTSLEENESIAASGKSVPVTWAPTSGAAPTGRSYRLSLSHSQGELGVLCQTSHLLDGGASLEAAWAEETHTHTQPVKNSSTVTSVC